MTEKEMIVFGNCPWCGAPAQVIAGSDNGLEGAAKVASPLTYRHQPELASSAFQNDVAAILVALGLGDHARPMSAHSVVREEIIPAIQRLVSPADLPSPTETGIPANQGQVHEG